MFNRVLPFIYVIYLMEVSLPAFIYTYIFPYIIKGH